MASKLSLPLRIILGIAIPLTIAGLAVFLYIYGSPFPCVFYEITGIYCGGCGAGRCAYDLIHLNILEAIGHNALFVLVLPFVALYLFKLYVLVVFRKDVLKFLVIGKRMSFAILIIVIAFIVLRNVPIFPFSVLAP